MFRKLAFAIAATAALGTASLALTSTPAEAKKGFHKHHHHGHSHHFHGPRFIAGPTVYVGGCYVKRWVATPWGLKLRWVNVCF
jgi:hypothetical protein